MTGQRFDDLPRAQQAGIMCNDPEFQTFVALRTGVGFAFTSSATAEWLRRWCGIRSRRFLDQNPDAASSFDTLKTEFDAHRGRIPPQR